MEQLRAAAAAWGTGASIGLFARSQADDPAARKAQARFERESASPAMARALIESLMLTDVEGLLARISVPTLVVRRTGDIVPVEEGRFIAGRVASSQFRELPGVDHRPWAGDSQAVISEIERFTAMLAPAPAQTAGPDRPRRRRPARQLTGWESLTEREHAVAVLVAAGCSNPEIARRLFISRETVQTHLKHIFSKLGVDSRTALAPWPPASWRQEIPDFRDVGALRAAHDAHMGITGWITCRGQQTPGKTAARSGHRSVTYAELEPDIGSAGGRLGTEPDGAADPVLAQASGRADRRSATWTRCAPASSGSNGRICTLYGCADNARRQDRGWHMHRFSGLAGGAPKRRG